ncbi:MAG: hypothetical protein LBK47_06925 [Prevotellaceae bacterium]|nr:hypothetical protein [Prevotellaceae bacterium]
MASPSSGFSTPLRRACPERSRGSRNDEAEVPPLRYASVGMTRVRGKIKREGFAAATPPQTLPYPTTASSFRPSPRGTSGRMEEPERSGVRRSQSLSRPSPPPRRTLRQAQDDNAHARAVDLQLSTF